MDKTTTQPNSATNSNSMDCTGTLEEFIATGRTGRRNAMPDILDEQKAAVGTGGLAFDMKKMNCSDDSKTVNPAPSAATNTQSSQGS